MFSRFLFCKNRFNLTNSSPLCVYRPYRPNYLRGQLLKFVRLFPRNTVFLNLFAWAADSGVRLDDPVRQVLRDTVFAATASASKSDCVGTRAFAVRYEMVRAGGNRHSARAAFERALGGNGEACRDSAELWAAYIRFCSGDGNGRDGNSGGGGGGGRGKPPLRSSAKEVFYRAVRACPWSKELIMLGFAVLAGEEGVEPSELRAVFNTMQVRGLRLHVDLDVFTEEWNRKAAQRARRQGGRY